MGTPPPQPQPRLLVSCWQIAVVHVFFFVCCRVIQQLLPCLTFWFPTAGVPTPSVAPTTEGPAPCPPVNCPCGCAGKTEIHIHHDTVNNYYGTQDSATTTAKTLSFMDEVEKEARAEAAAMLRDLPQLRVRLRFSSAPTCLPSSETCQIRRLPATDGMVFSLTSSVLICCYVNRRTW